MTVVVAHPRLLETLVSERVSPRLKEAGYRRSGLRFERDAGEALAIVQFQRSRRETGCDRFTVNVGVASKRLLTFEGLSGTRLEFDQFHWKKRLGRTTDDPHDEWWELCSETDVDSIASRVVSILVADALPQLDRMSSDMALTSEWLEGRSPGLTELQRLMGLTVLLDVDDKRQLQAEYIQKLKDYGNAKGLRGRVGVHLEDLGVE